ncbi:hypothetical protein FAES_0044 [Fibrella aestuarina BUZ 2]|uniref:Uncharacterized protein n=1 Tax=Fibrella aestuarina BUZ 2 TaxID=1166018 RepID=I0K1Q5_9BACT|nr:hypothetical protein FAES_0044 [Fibrella aestuarina BUZ 2]
MQMAQKQTAIANGSAGRLCRKSSQAIGYGADTSIASRVCLG